MRRTLRIGVGLLCMALCLVGALGIVGCKDKGSVLSGVGDEEAIRTGIEQELDLLVSPSQENLTVFLADVSNEDLEYLKRTYNVDVSEFLSHVFREFSYNIERVSINGEEATATVAITGLDAAQAVAAASEKVSAPDEAKALADLYNAGQNAELVQRVFGIVYQCLDEVDDRVTREIELNLTKNNNKWTIESQSLDDLLNAMLGGLQLSDLPQME